LHVETLKEDREVVKAAPLIAFGAAENRDMNANVPADVAATLLPGSVLQDVPIDFGPCPLSIVDLLILSQRLKHIVYRNWAPIERVQHLQAPLFEAPRRSLVNLPR